MYLTIPHNQGQGHHHHHHASLLKLSTKQASVSGLGRAGSWFIVESDTESDQDEYPANLCQGHGQLTITGIDDEDHDTLNKFFYCKLVDLPRKID